MQLVTSIVGGTAPNDPTQLVSKLIQLGILNSREREGEGEEKREGSKERGGGGAVGKETAPPEVINTQVPLSVPTLTFTVATLKR